MLKIIAGSYLSLIDLYLFFWLQVLHSELVSEDVLDKVATWIQRQVWAELIKINTFIEKAVVNTQVWQQVFYFLDALTLVRWYWLATQLLVQGHCGHNLQVIRVKWMQLVVKMRAYQIDLWFKL